MLPCLFFLLSIKIFKKNSFKNNCYENLWPNFIDNLNIFFIIFQIQLIEISSTSNTKTAFGGITGGAPSSP